MSFAPDPYFALDDPRKWTPSLFGRNYLREHPGCSQQIILDIYLKSLSYISTDLKATDRARKKAVHLLQKYRESGEPKRCLKGLWEVAQSKQGAPPLVINNSTVGLLNTGTFENRGYLGVDTAKRPSDDEEDAADGEGGVAGEDPKPNEERPKKKAKHVSSPLESFVRMFEAMDDASMWRLSTGKVVEKCIYRGVISSTSVEGLAHMWIISSKDPWMKALFTKEELVEIFDSRVIQKPTEPAQACWDLLSKFKNVTTIEGLEAILFGNPPEMGKHTEWVDGVMRQMRILLKHPKAPLLTEHGENWYEVNVWGPIVDHLFLHAAECIEVDRKEVACSATTLRLNEGRTQTGKGHYTVTGNRSDAIIRAIDSHGPLEYGAIEVKPGFAGETSTDYLDDYEKLMITLGHMLPRLVQSVNAADVKKLEVVGMIIAGLHCQIIRMWTPNGNVYVTAPDTLYKVPTSIQCLKDIIPLLFSIWQMMNRIVTCLEVVNGSDRYGSMSLNDFL